MRRIDGYPLWLGHIGDARNAAAIHAAGILVLVDLALNEAPIVPARELAYLRFPLLDGPGNPHWLLRAAIQSVAGLVRDGTPTLLFCGAGMSRTPGIAGAALARVRGCPASEGLAIAVRSGAADITPGLWSEIQAVLG